jgi:hypothetical protein
VVKRHGERLIAAWLPPGFHAAMTALAKNTGLSKSEVVRRSLANTALRLAEERDDEPRADT